MVISQRYKFIRIDGSTAAGVRQGLCDHFQQDKDCLVAVLSITAANTGKAITEGVNIHVKGHVSSIALNFSKRHEVFPISFR